MRSLQFPKPTIPLGQVSVRRITTIHDVPAEDWDEVVPSDAFYDCHAWLAVVEQDRTAQPCYWLVRSAGRMIGALATYRVHLEGLPMANPAQHPATRDVDGTFLVAGSRRGYRTRLLRAPELSEREAATVTGMLLEAALEKAVRDGCDGLGFMYLNADDAELLRAFFGARLVELDRQAHLHLQPGTWETWLQSLSRKTRYTIRSEGRGFKSAGLTCGLEDFEENIPLVAHLAAATEERHGHQATSSSIERVLRHQHRGAGTLARLFMTRDDSDRPVACSLHFEGRDSLFSRLYGADPAWMPGAYEYFNTLFYAPIAYALSRDLRDVHFGTGSLRAKELRGARLERSFAAFVSVRP